MCDNRCGVLKNVYYKNVNFSTSIFLNSKVPTKKIEASQLVGGRSADSTCITISTVHIIKNTSIYHTNKVVRGKLQPPLEKSWPFLATVEKITNIFKNLIIYIYVVIHNTYHSYQQMLKIVSGIVMQQNTAYAFPNKLLTTN